MTFDHLGQWFIACIMWFVQWVRHLGVGDSWDGFWYNNSEAIGQQLYPEGVSKYYDLYSSKGQWDYVWALIWFEISDALGVFLFFIPLDYWFAIFAGQSWDGILDAIWYYVPFGDWIVVLFDIKVQDGWRMM